MSCVSPTKLTVVLHRYVNLPIFQFLSAHTADTDADTDIYSLKINNYYVGAVLAPACCKNVEKKITNMEILNRIARQPVCNICSALISRGGLSVQSFTTTLLATLNSRRQKARSSRQWLWKKLSSRRTKAWEFRALSAISCVYPWSSAYVRICP